MIDSAKPPEFPGPKSGLPEVREEVTKFELSDGVIIAEAPYFKTDERNEKALIFLYSELRTLAAEISYTVRGSNMFSGMSTAVDRYLDTIPLDLKDENPIRAYIAGEALASRISAIRDEDPSFIKNPDFNDFEVLLRLHYVRMSNLPWWREFQLRLEGQAISVDEMDEVDRSIGRIASQLEEMADLVDGSVIDALSDVTGYDSAYAVRPATTQAKIRTLENLVITLARSSLEFGDLDENDKREGNVEKSWVASSLLSSIKNSIEFLSKKIYRMLGWISELVTKLY